MSNAAHQLEEPLGYPQIEPESATSDTLYSLYERNGVFLFRRLLSPEDIDALRQIGNICYAVGEAIASNASADQLPPEITDGLIVRGYISWTRMTALIAASATKLGNDLDRIAGKVGSIAKMVYADPTVELLEGFSVIRRHRRAPPTKELSRVPWHRDFSFVGPAGIENSVNFWIPLAEVGTLAPSIEVIVGSHNHMVNVPDETPGITNIAEDWVASQLAGYSRWTPHCAPGDVMVFDHQTVHRTQLLAASIDRMNFEMRWSPGRK